MLSFQASVVLVLVSAVLFSEGALDLDLAREMECYEADTVSVSLAWILSHKRYYYIASNRMDLYKGCIETSGRPAENLTEAECIEKACYITDIVRGWLSVHMEWGAFGVFNNKELTITPINGMEKYEFMSETGNYGGTVYSAKTDNKSYILLLCCILGDLTWTIATPFKTLPEETMKEILDYVVQLGFSLDNLVLVDFVNGCDTSTWIRRSGNEEL